MIQVAQIGVGYWGPNLLRNLISNRECQVKTVVDMAKDRRDYAKNLYPSIQVSEDIRDIVGDQDINAVVIATPVKTHYDLAMTMLSAGKHVLVEKPMATNLTQIEALQSLAKKNSLVAMAGHTC